MPTKHDYYEVLGVSKSAAAPSDGDGDLCYISDTSPRFDLRLARLLIGPVSLIVESICASMWAHHPVLAPASAGPFNLGLSW